jgi:hypothetical protein
MIFYAKSPVKSTKKSDFAGKSLSPESEINTCRTGHEIEVGFSPIVPKTAS